MPTIQEYMPHGFCIAWNPHLLAMHVISDLFIALAYFSIPVGIVYVARRRPDTTFQPIYYLFAGFILACGVTHVMGIVTLWYPVYYFEGLTKVGTAIISVATALYVLPKLKHIMALPDLNTLSQMNNDLKQEVEFRKKTEASLLVSQAQALQSQKTQAAFLANMSHEIRTPMNGVLGALNLLLDTNLKESQYRLADAAKKSAHSLLHLLDDILDISKVESGQMVLKLEQVSMGPLLEEVGSALAFEADRRGIELICPANPVMDDVFLADPGRIRQILINLIGNSIKFTSSGHVRVSCQELQDEGTHKLIEFTVQDTGEGIDPKFHAQVFERFKQADDSSSRRAQGTGLGLAIVRELVALMEGQIELKSALKQGTEIRFTLRLMVDRAADRKGALLVADRLAGQVSVMFKDSLVRAYVIDLLNHWGYPNRTDSKPNAGPNDVLLVSSSFLDFHPELLQWLDLLTPAERPKVVLALRQLEQNNHRLLQRPWVGATVVKPIAPSDLSNALLALLAPELQDKTHAVPKTLSGRVKFEGRVLVVEDAPMNQMVILKVLENLGLQPVLANHGEEAIALAKCTAFDVILMDGQMPVMDGYEATRLIRSGQVQGIDPAVPIVALTAHAIKGEDDKCFEAGMNDYLTKPLDVKQLVQVLGKYLKIVSP